jgi:hypothetical protein
MLHAFPLECLLRVAGLGPIERSASLRAKVLSRHGLNGGNFLREGCIPSRSFGDDVIAIGGVQHPRRGQIGDNPSGFVFVVACHDTFGEGIEPAEAVSIRIFASLAKCAT